MSFASNLDSKVSNVSEMDLFGLEFERNRLAQLYSVFVTRLVFSSLGVASLTFFLAASSGGKQRAFGILWLLIALWQTAFLLLSQKTRSEKGFLCMACCLVLGILAWWCGSLLLIALAPSLAALILTIVIIILGTLPWPLSFDVTLHIVFTLAVTYVSLRCNQPMLWWFVMMSAVFVSLRSAARSHLFFCLNSTERASSTEKFMSLEMSKLVTLYARQFARCLEQKIMLLNSRSEEAMMIEGSSIEISKTDPVFVKGFIQGIAPRSESIGIKSKRLLGQQFTPIFHDWFGFLPTHFFFGRFVIVRDDKEEELLLVIPTTPLLTLVGIKYSFRYISGAFSWLQMILALQRNRMISSGIFSATQQSISDQEFELNELIHQVNNTSQDIAILCDGIGQKLELLVSSPELAASSASMRNELERVEAASRHLSHEVSDLKLLREMARVKEIDLSEMVDVGAVLEEVRLYAEHRAFRKGIKFALKNNVPAATAVKTKSREYLETALRHFVRVVSQHVVKDGAMELVANLVGERVEFLVQHNGPFYLAELKECLRRKRFSKSSEHFAALLGLFAGDSDGIAVLDSSPEFSNRLVCRLPATENHKQPRRVLGQWTLLVDDSPEVTTFYSRIADAFQLGALTASSLKEAREIIKDRGKPRFVITDVHLGQGSGWELVDELRAKFGEELPIIVVSGESDDGIQARSKRLASVRYLTKPVGRKKLFAEIKEILSK